MSRSNRGFTVLILGFGFLCTVAAGTTIAWLAPAWHNSENILIAASLNLVAVGMVFSSCGGGTRLLSPSLIYVLISLIFINFGGFLVVLGLEQPAQPYPRATESVLMLASWAVFVFSLGVVLVNRVTGFQPAIEIANYFANPIIDDLRSATDSIQFAVLTLIGLGTTAVLFYTAGSPLFSRSILSSDLTESGLFVGLSYLLPVVLLMAIVRSTLRNERVALTLLGFGLAIFVAGGDLLAGSRYMIWGLTIILTVAFQTTGALHLGKQPWVPIAALVFLVCVFVFIGASREQIIWDQPLPQLLDNIWRAFSRRVFLIETGGLSFILIYFPHPYNYLSGYTYIDQLRSMLPFVQPEFELARWISAQVGHIFGGTPAYIPLTFAGEAYANFGPIGMLAMCFAWGVILQLFYIRFIRSRRTLSSIIIFTIMAQSLGRSALLGVVFPLRTVTYLLLIFLLPLVLRASIKYRDPVGTPRRANATVERN